MGRHSVRRILDPWSYASIEGLWDEEAGEGKEGELPNLTQFTGVKFVAAQCSLESSLCSGRPSSTSVRFGR